MSGAVIALIVIGVVMVLGIAAASVAFFAIKKAIKSVPTAEPVPRTTVKAQVPPPPPADKWITEERPYVKFLTPTGWNTHITTDKEWGIFKSAKKDAVLAFTTFSRPGESTLRLSRAAAVLGVTDIAWGATRTGTVGKDQFEARTGEGSCNFEGPGGYIWYATVNTGTSDQILLIFTVASNAPQARRAEAKAAIDSLQRR